MIERIKLEQQVILAIHHGPMRAVCFIEAEDVIIGIKGLNIHRAVRRIGDGIDTDFRTIGVGIIGKFADRVDFANDVGHVRDANQFGAVAHRGLEAIKAETPGFDIGFPETDVHTEFLECDPRADIAFMVADGNDNLVTRFELAAHGTREVLQQYRGRGAENDFFGAARIDQLGGRLARIQKGFGRLLRDFVGAADLHIALDQKRIDAVQRLGQDLRSAGIVKEGPALGKGGKLAVDIVHIKGTLICH